LQTLVGARIDTLSLGRKLLTATRPFFESPPAALAGLPEQALQDLAGESLLCAPIRPKGRNVGAVILDYPAGQTIAPSDLYLVDGVAAQLALMIENAYAIDKIELQRHKLEQLSLRLLNAQETERTRIARELHDGLSQTLSACKLVVERLVRKTTAGNQAQLTQLAETLGHATLELRQLCAELHPAHLDHLGLVATVRWFARTFGALRNTPIQVDVTGNIPKLSPEQAINLFRIVQEAVSNASKHASATKILIALRREGNQIRITVEDDGCGFDLGSVQQSRDPGLGMGLLTMRERARLLGSALVITTRPGHATRISVSVATDDPDA
jgi:signal transduction histidine kinase